MPMNTLPISIPDIQYLRVDRPLELEAGGRLDSYVIGYHTFGRLNASKDNVIWVCHALTANSNVVDWWAGLCGPDKLFDLEKNFIVCANIIGSCYGTTGARSINPMTGTAYGKDFPLVTIRDQVKGHIVLMEHLDLPSIGLCIGGSGGGHQVLEMGYALKDRINRMVLLVSSARESAWAIASHEGQRKALEADDTLWVGEDWAGKKGLMGARAMAMLNYRTFESYVQRQTNEDTPLDDFKASSYVAYQGQKLSERFYAQSYYHLTKSLDTHHIGRNRGSLEQALSEIEIPALVIGVSSDRLIPNSEQQYLAEHLQKATLSIIDSNYGHDGFLVETEKINSAVFSWLKKAKV